MNLNRLGAYLGSAVALLLIVANAAAQAPLGAASTYAVLAGSGVTNSGSSVIDGNVGSSPTATVAGIPPGLVVAPFTPTTAAAAALAQTDLATAYNILVALPCTTNLTGQDLGSLTALTPGVYCFNSSAQLTGTLTLDGQNDPSAAFTFQIGSTLATASASEVVLINGAQPGNVFWQVGSTATLGTTTAFQGNIVAYTSVSFHTGATLTGRALAQNGSATLVDNTVTIPGSITLVKNTVGGDGTFTFTDNFGVASLTTIGSTTSQTISTLTPGGIYFVDETVPSGWTQTSASCTNGTPASITVVSGATTTCTFTNTAAALAASQTITFNNPGTQNFGASPTLTATATSGLTVTFTSSTTGVCTITSGGALTTITNGTCTINANQAGNSSFLAAPQVSQSFSITAVAPGAPTIGSATAGNAQASVTFTAPASNGGSAITVYTATSSTGGLIGTAASSPVTVTGLTNGQAYTFTVTATNTASTSVASAPSNSVTPAASQTITFNNPGAQNFGTSPTLTATATSGLTVTFTSSTTGVCTITSGGALTTITNGTCTISANQAGNANFLAAPQVSQSFSIAAGAPGVNSTLPAGGAVNVPVGSPLSAVFSEAMNPLTINTSTFKLRQGATPVLGTVTYAGVTATFIPLSALATNTLFTATITTGVADLAGTTLVFNYSWSFTTGDADLTPPAVISTIPANGATQVTPSANIVVNFNQLLNTLLTSTITFTLKQGTTPVQGAVTFAGSFATFDPTFNLAPHTIYTATLTDTTTNPAARTLTGSLVWSFTTGSSTDQPAVCLSNFAVLSGLGIISSGPSAITGDIGVSAGASVTGFPPGTLTGAILAGDAAAAQGILDLSAGYANAVGRLVGAVPVSGDLGGQTFTAGLYNSISSLSITSGNLTLDAKSDPNAVFIFQMASTLTTAPGSQIILAGGASASNVFWQVGTSATLGANSVFSGSILANQSITLNTGAAVNGRLLAENGTVTLASNIIASPPPSISVGGLVNAASDAQTAAAGSIISVFGDNLGSSLTTATGYPLPTTLGGTSFQIGTLAAPLYMTSCSQVNLQIPWRASGQVNVTATVGGLVSTGETITIVPFAPGIFSLNQAGSGQGAVEIAATGQLAAPLADAGVPVKPGQYIAIFATGLGPVSNEPATGSAALSDPLSSTLTVPIVTIGGAAAKVVYSGLAPGFAGLYQVNALVPDGAPTGDSVNLLISMGGVESNTVTIAVQ
jgi:uncharacterized protein (TIGR03437 family)